MKGKPQLTIKTRLKGNFTLVTLVMVLLVLAGGFLVANAEAEEMGIGAVSGSGIPYEASLEIRESTPELMVVVHEPLNETVPPERTPDTLTTPTKTDETKQTSISAARRTTTDFYYPADYRDYWNVGPGRGAYDDEGYRDKYRHHAAVGSYEPVQSPVYPLANDIGLQYKANLTATSDSGSDSGMKTDFITTTDPAGPSVLPGYNNIFVKVANNAGVKYNAFGNNTYNIRFEGVNRGLNALHISTDPVVNCGQVTVSENQSGTLYATDSGGKGYEDEIILMVAVNRTIPDSFKLHVTADGYTWTPNPQRNRAPSLDNVTYQPVSLNETFTKDDFIYGPQIWKPTGNAADYPLYAGQDMSNAENAFRLMFIDLNAGVLRPNETLKNRGAVRINYTFENLKSFAAFSVYGYCRNSNNGDDMVAWTNALTSDKAMSGYSVIGGTGLPVAAFTAEPQKGTAPLVITFTDTSTGDPAVWLWDFGDDNISSERNPVYTYTAPGNHTVTLSVNGGTETCTKPGYIKVTPVLFGDANEDGRVNQADTLTVLQQVVGLREKPVPGTDRFKKTDAHANGVIEVGDALFIAQYNVGLRDVWFEAL